MYSKDSLCDGINRCNNVIFHTAAIGGIVYLPKLTNIHGNVILELDLIKNKHFDVNKGRESFENWIPFVFSLRIADNEEYSYPKWMGATFSLEDISLLIAQLGSAINLKNTKKLVPLFWGPTENYFSLKFYDTYEENEIYIDLWLMMGELTQGKTYGYNKGFRFAVSLNNLEKFTIQLKKQLTILLVDTN